MSEAARVVEKTLELELIPADGRDYLSGSLAVKAWNDEVEFTVRGARWTTGEAYDIGLKRFTRSLAAKFGVTAVRIHFNANGGYRSYVRSTPPGTDWL